MERSRFEQESGLGFEVYQKLSRELEQAPTRVSQESHVFSVRKPATVPTRPVGVGLIKTMAVAGFLGGLFGLALVSWRSFRGLGLQVPVPVRPEDR